MGVKGVVVFQDDILMGSPDDDSHLVVVQNVLDILKKSNLKIIRDKSEVLAPKIEFLGHTLSKEGITPIGSKIQALVDTAIPDTPNLLH